MDKKKVFIAIILFIVLVVFFRSKNSEVSVECSKDNLLVNGSFEESNDTVGLVNSYALNGLMNSDLGWDVYKELPGEGGEGVSWVATEGAGIEVQYLDGFIEQLDGVYVVELDSFDDSANGNSSNTTMEQTITIDGGDYYMTFLYKPRSEAVEDSAIEILVDGNVIVTQSNTDQTWQLVRIDLEEFAAGEHTIGFKAAGVANTYGGLLDDVILKCMD